MCGFAGILTLNPTHDLKSISSTMLGTLRHRGPDDEGSVELRLPNGFRLLLVQTRLSILDLSPAGHQPMHDADSDSWIVYNGEIYNHVEVRRRLNGASFRSSCDTETVLKAWVERGPECLPALRGMFAFAIYDRRDGQLWLARDRMGIKPLYVSQPSPETLLFASEVRTLLESRLISRRLNRAAVRSYLAFGAASAPWTMLEGVESVLPGETWCIDLNQPGRIAPITNRYWFPPFRREKQQVSYRDAIEQVGPVLLESLNLHTTSDVPVSVFLSGGIDSSSIVAGLSYLGHRVRTFSIRFGEEDFDETVHARHVAARFGTEHAELYLPPSKVLAGLDAAMSAYDQPSIDGINTFFISQAVHESGLKVAISGLGGDELFAGYSMFWIASLLDRPMYRKLGWAIQLLLAQRSPGAMRTDKLKAILATKGSRLDMYAVFRQVMLESRLHELLVDGGQPGLSLPRKIIDELQTAAEQLDAPNACSLFELSLYLGNMLLRDTDQMSMAHSIEVRVPLLDHQLTETVASLPGSLKLPGWHPASKKRLLIDSLPVKLPPGIASRRKMGFVFPWEIWLRGQLRNVVASTLGDWETLEAAGLRPAVAMKLWTQFLNCKPGIRYTDILDLVHLLSWIRAHKVSL